MNKKNNATIKNKDPRYVVVAFKMQCGCLRCREELVTGHNPNGLRCPVHTEFGILYILKECVGCSNFITMPPGSPTTIRCVSCRIIHKRIMNRKSSRKKETPRLRAQLIQAAVGAGDCIHRMDCIDTMMKTKEYLPCLTCNRYISIRSAVAGDCKPTQIRSDYRECRQ